MSSRDDILSRVRSNQPEPAPRPDLDGRWTTYADRERQLGEVLKFVGGELKVAPKGELESVLRGLPGLQGAKNVVSRVGVAGLATVDLDAVADPHQLEDVDVAVLAGEFAVAENAAVWVSDRTVRHRAVYFLAQHLVLVVPRKEIVDTLHQAYARIRFDSAGYGLFISGPSKTADIEQSLVIGAHGPRSLTLVLCES
jgi:L-lactate dehydrogenase complex protein LldG